ncbi:iron export ABC transporter permease subunit FetB [bacterium]|nr:iron export ABC transporter permease subunit FetB [bacterium]
MNEITFVDVAISLALVVLAFGVSRFWKVPVQKEMSLGVLRAFVQLVAVGYALDRIFAIDQIWLIALVMLVMLAVGAREASVRTKKLPGAFWLAFSAMTTGTVVTLAIMLATGLFELKAMVIIPLIGMLVSNSMNAATLTINRLFDNLTENRLAVETSLALGKNWRQASQRFRIQAATAGMVSIFNFMKTVGIVALPGAMTGMILAGKPPLEAALFQLIIGYMLLSAVTLTVVMTLELMVRRFFTPFDQFSPPTRG